MRVMNIETLRAIAVSMQLELVDELGQSLLAPYPPEDPLPPAARRGRKAQNGSRRG